MMNIFLVLIMSFFWVLLIYYSFLTLSGVIYRTKRKPKHIDFYPSVSILIPAHNEGKVIKNTLTAMAKLQYPGEMNIYLLNDNSVDETGEIADAFAKSFHKIHHINVPAGTPKGKSRVLNYGLSITESKYFLVFDADNQPEPDAVKLLVEEAETTPNAAGAVGYVKTINTEKNFLTRMIALEFQVYQLLMQCGRWFLFKTGSLTGTNMLLRRDIIDQIGGYDPYALAEDAELTIRLTTLGWKLPIVPEAKTWEQEPESIKVLVKQRTRWLQGNLYLLDKMFKQKEYWRNRTLVHTLQHLLVYFLFVILLLFSHTWFVVGLFGFPIAHIEAPIIMFWFMSYVVYTAQHLSATTLDKTNSPLNIAIAVIMYFTYAQLFLLLLIRSMVLYVKSKKKNQTIEWDKTIRF